MSSWLHASIPVLNAYDTENDEGRRPEQAVIEAQHFEALRSSMDRPMEYSVDLTWTTADGCHFNDGPADSDSDE